MEEGVYPAKERNVVESHGRARYCVLHGRARVFNECSDSGVGRPVSRLERRTSGWRAWAATSRASSAISYARPRRQRGSGGAHYWAPRFALEGMEKAGEQWRLPGEAVVPGVGGRLGSH